MNTLIKILCLLVIAALAVMAEYFFKDILLFTLSWKQNSGLADSLALLPALLIVQVLFRKYLAAREHLLHVTVIFYVLIFFMISPAYIWAVNFLGFFAFLYALEKLSREKSYFSTPLLIIMILLAVVPMIFYTTQKELSAQQIYFLVLFKSCFLMRVLSWFIDRRVYKRVNYDSFLEYLEFLFCPIFFIFPGQIQFFLFDYFHRNKVNPEEKIDAKTVIWLGVWGLSLMVLYSWLDSFFWHKYSVIPYWMGKWGFWPVQFMIGFFWLLTVYFQQTAGMAYQITLGRVIGYNFKYDMHWPLLARSPLDYLRRHSSYVRDYIVEMGLKPLALVCLRKGMSSKLVLPVASVISYAFFISLQSGYRPDYNRSWMVTGVMILFLMIFIALPYIGSYFKKNHSTDTLLKEAHMKPVIEWKLRDFVLWIGTLFILCCYKMFLGLAK